MENLKKRAIRFPASLALLLLISSGALYLPGLVSANVGSLRPFLADLAVATFAADCVTPRTTFNPGDTICAQVSNIDPPIAQARFDFVDPDGVIQQRGLNITVDRQTATFLLPLGATTGKWKVNISYNSDSSVIGTTAFTVYPSPTVTSPAAPIAVNTAAFTIAGTAMADSLVKVYRDLNNNGSIDAGDSVVSSQQLSGGGATFSISTPLISDAANDFVVTASDASGNESTPVNVPTITQDSTPPAGPVVTNPAAAITVRAATFTISGTAEVNSLVKIYGDANNNNVIDGSDNVVASQQLAGGATAFSIVTPLSQNSANNFLATAADLVGNMSAPTDVPTITEAQPTVSVVKTFGGAEPSADNLFTISLSHQTTQQVTVNYATSDGTATAGGDYTAKSGTITFTAGTATLTQTVTVTTLDDVVFEGAENFNFTLSSPTNATIGGTNPAIGTITDNESQPTVSIVKTTGGGEPVTDNLFTVTLSGQTTQQVTINYATSDGTGTAGSDYAAKSGTLTFAANTGALTQTILVQTLDDALFEGTENFTVLLSQPTNASITGTNPAVGTITDNESQPTVSITSLNQGNEEGLVPNRFRVTLSGASASIVTVNYATSDNTPAPSAIAGQDYTAANGTLTFNSTVADPNTDGDSNPLTQTVSVQTLQDLISEFPETFNISLSAPVNTSIVIGTAVGTIIDNDGAGFVTISGNIKQAPGNTNLSGVTVVLSGSSSGTTTTDSNGNYSFQGLLSGGSYIVTPSGLGNSYDPVNRSYNNQFTSVSNADFAAYAGTVPRTLSIPTSYATPGQNADVLVNVTSLGNEKTFTFMLNYDPAVLNLPVATCGTSDPGCTVTQAVTPGSITVSVTPANQIAKGDRNIVKVTFGTFQNEPANTSISFSPNNRSVTDQSNNPLSASYSGPALIIFAIGVEGDVWNTALGTPGNGDGTVDALDVLREAQLVTNKNLINQTNNEFQRADTAEYQTKGNGVIDTSDLVQTLLYFNGQNGGPHVTAGGPFQPNAASTPLTRPLIADASAGKGRTMRVVSTTATKGGDALVSIELDSRGDEVAASFSLRFDRRQLSIDTTSGQTNPDITLGTSVPSGTGLMINADDAKSGRLGIAVFNSNLMPFAKSGAAEEGSGRQVITLRFHIAADAKAGATSIAFDASKEASAQLSLASGLAESLTSAYTDGVITIDAQTQLGAEITGRVLTPDSRGLRNARVTLVDSTGQTRTAITTAFGEYRFDSLSTGSTVTLSVSSKTYRYATRTVRVSDNLTDVDFIGIE